MDVKSFTIFPKIIFHKYFLQVLIDLRNETIDVYLEAFTLIINMHPFHRYEYMYF